MKFEPIAIVGRSCILPGANDPDTFNERIRRGDDLITDAPAGRFRLGERAFDEDGVDGAWSDRGGYVTGFEKVWDPTGFGELDPLFLEQLDPVFKWTLHGVRQALRDAGAEGFAGRSQLVMGNLSFPSSEMSMFGESTWLDRAGGEFAGSALRRAIGVHRSHPENRFMSGMPATLTASALGLGSGYALDAACASSLYAVRLACDRLQARELDLAVAGAVNASDPLFIHVGFCALNAMSKTGQSRPFHAGADGLVPAEGAAFVVLKRLDDALANGDEIAGVIRGVGLSNDGRGRGFLAPAKGGQVRAMKAALQMAGLQPSDVPYVECHATGTTLGDATELESMAQVWDAPPIVGSHKSNIGHAITAAGLAGLLKVVGALEEGVVPPTLHAAESPSDELANLGFQLGAGQPWEGPKRAAVSAFGFGGNNAHLIVERLDEWESTGIDAAQATPLEAPALVVTDVEIVATSAGAPALRSWLRDGAGPDGIESIEVDLDGLRFPPRDLEQATGQQLLMLEAARRLAQRHDFDGDRTAILVGMEADASVIRFGARWRAREWGDALNDQGWGEAAADAFAPLLRSDGVIGTMPNIPANRVNSQLDLRGPSFTVSSGSDSGLSALEAARSLLMRGDADVVLVGASDCASEPTHTEAARALGEERPTGDAAAIVVVTRAEVAGDDAIATLEFGVGVPDEGDADDWHPDPLPTSIHAAESLVELAVSVEAVRHGVRPGTAGLDGPLPWMTADGTRTARVGAGTNAVVVRSRAAVEAVPVEAERSIEVYRGADRDEVIERFEQEQTGGDGPATLAVVRMDGQAPENVVSLLRAGRTFGDRFAFRDAPVDGELAFVFTGSASPYRGMGKELYAHLPEVWTKVAQRCGDARRGAVADVIFGEERPLEPDEQIFSASFYSQAHAILSREILGLHPAAAIGYSLGESSALFAMGAWDDLDAMLDELPETKIFSHSLAGDYAAIRKAWSAGGHVEAATHDEIPWANWTLIAPVEEVRAAVADEPLAHVAMVNTPHECVLSGFPDACDRVLQTVLNSPKAHATRLPSDVAIHVPEVAEIAESYRDLHSRPTRAVDGVRFYSNATNEAYTAERETCADAILGQATGCLDFTRTVQQAWDDGVRVFLEHGPRSLCTNWIHRILGDRDYVAISLDRPGASALDSAFVASAHLIAAGVDVDLGQLTGRLKVDGQSAAKDRKSRPAMAKMYQITAPEVALPLLSGRTAMERPDELASVASEKFEARLAQAPESSRPVGMLKTPAIGAHLEESMDVVGHRPVAESAAPSRDVATPQISPTNGHAHREPRGDSFEPNTTSNGVAARHFDEPVEVDTRRSPIAAVGAVHRSFMEQQTALYHSYLELHARNLARMQAAVNGEVAQLGSFDPARLLQAPSPAPPASITPRQPQPISAPRRSASAPAEPLDDPRTPLEIARETGTFEPLEGEVVLTREDLEYLAHGDISKLFGETFEPQRHKRIQCRMPEPPLLLCDRVVGIDAEPASMAPGTMWTETDVRRDAWYTHCGRMPAGVMIESGQADLLLVSWLGIDLEVDDGRAYRLLGCELTYQNDLPKAGDTLHYEIHIDGFARHGGVRIFFFHYDCTVNGEPFLRVRSGQAGFFTDEELENSGGILWTPREGEHDAAARLDDPVERPARTKWDEDDLAAFADGRIWEVFGEDYRFTRTHVRTPTVARRDMLFIDRVTDLDFDGGPWGKGYLRATEKLSPDDWFFEGHFHNDPCMPGTLMFEGTLQTMAFWMAAAGVTIRRDGWRFQPVRDEQFAMRCRGQATPESNECVYELFVEEFHNGEDGENPKLFADLLVTVDGRKAFHCRRMGLELVPDYPLSSGAAELDEWERDRPGSPTGQPAAIDYPAMLATAWGSPVQAFGEMYEDVNYTAHRAPRLPGPPYHFMTRVMEESGHLTRKPGAHAVVEYDVPADAWYFAPDVGDGEMPFAVLLETGLQPCGWLATWVGCAVEGPEVFFRNLDGTGTLHRPITPDVGTISTRADLTRVARSGGMTIVAFDVTMHDAAGELLYDMDTMFGFFPEGALAEQAGIPEAEGERQTIEADVEEFTGLRDDVFGNRSRWDLLDRVAYWPDGGASELGRVRARFDVDPGDWFFKAHFYADPVQPGSIGLEAVLEGVRWWARHEGLAESVTLATDAPHTWQYRGQVRPWNEQATAIFDVVERAGPFVVVDASLWCDGQKIYTFTGVRLELLALRDPT